MAVLLNWVVQSVIVAAAATAGLRALASAPARVRYRFAHTAYGLVLVLPVLHFFATQAAPGPRTVAAAGLTPIATLPVFWWTAPYVAAVLCLAWSAFHATRLGMDAFAIYQTRRRSWPCPRSVLATLPHWPHVSATGRPVRVVLSEGVHCAAVLGCGTRVVALAPDLVDRLDADDLDRILVHEWAHVQRRDDVAQMARRIVHVLVGWHPAVWWLERKVAFECEAACDEVAVSATGSAKGYARCLVKLASMPRGPVRALPIPNAMLVSGTRRRVMRILASNGRRRPRAATAIFAAAGLLVLSVTVSHFRAFAISAVESVLPTTTLPLVVEAMDTFAPRDLAPVSTAPASADASPRMPVGELVTAAPQVPTASAAVSAAVEQPGSPADMESAVPLPSSAWTTAAALATPPAAVIPVSQRFDSASLTETPERAGGPTPWSMAAGAGTAVGRATQGASLATAGFFTRLGKTIAHSF